MAGVSPDTVAQVERTPGLVISYEHAADFYDATRAVT